MCGPFSHIRQNHTTKEKKTHMWSILSRCQNHTNKECDGVYTKKEKNVMEQLSGGAPTRSMFPRPTI